MNKNPSIHIPFAKEDVLVGIGPNTWRHDDSPELITGNSTFEQALSEIALAGYDGCEVNNLFPGDAVRVKEAIDLRGLRIASAWYSSFLATQPYEQCEASFIHMLDYLETVRSDGVNLCEQSYSLQKEIGVPIYSKKPALTDEEWKRMTDGLKKFGKLAKDRGMKMTYHHHIGTVVCTPDEVDRLLNAVSPELLSLCYDCSHFEFYGVDAAEMARKYASRTGHIHLKSIRRKVLERVKNEKLNFVDSILLGGYSIPGDGDTDFIPILQAFADAGYKGWLLLEPDQDPKVTEPLYYAIEGRKYVRKVTGL